MNKQFGKVVLIQGGNSPERETSLDSAKMVGAELEKICEQLVYFDPATSNIGQLCNMGVERAFIITHGGSGEDGTLQAALKMLGILHTGSAHHACSVAMDKNLTKLKWSDIGLSTPSWFLVEDCREETLDEIQLQLGLDLFVKPNKGGSSISTRKISNRRQLAEAIDDSLRYDEQVLVEQTVPGMELTYGIVGEQVLPGIRIEVVGKFYDYDAKYVDGRTRFICPPDIPKEVNEECSQLALAAFKSLGCSGWGRVDMMVSGREPYLLEVNPVPGMTSHSLIPYAASKAGMDKTKLVTRILELVL